MGLGLLCLGYPLEEHVKDHIPVLAGVYSVREATVAPTEMLSIIQTFLFMGAFS